MSDPIRHLIEELARLPGIGEKTAARLTFHILRGPRQHAKSLAQALLDLAERVGLCRECQGFTEGEVCRTCQDPRRDGQLICVVEGVADQMAIERSGEFRGRYHVLHGALSPLDGVGPQDLRIRELLARLESGTVREVILATDPDVEGDATALYLARLVKPLGLRVTRIASGVPTGGELEYADQVTLARALAGRREL